MLLHWMANFTCILCIFKIQNTVFVFKYIFPLSILYFYFKYPLMYLCPSLDSRNIGMQGAQQILKSGFNSLRVKINTCPEYIWESLVKC